METKLEPKTLLEILTKHINEETCTEFVRIVESGLIDINADQDYATKLFGNVFRQINNHDDKLQIDFANYIADQCPCIDFTDILTLESYSLLDPCALAVLLKHGADLNSRSLMGPKYKFRDPNCFVMIKEFRDEYRNTLLRSPNSKVDRAHFIIAEYRYRVALCAKEGRLEDIDTVLNTYRENFDYLSNEVSTSELLKSSIFNSENV